MGGSPEGALATLRPGQAEPPEYEEARRYACSPVWFPGAISHAESFIFRVAQAAELARVIQNDQTRITASAVFVFTPLTSVYQLITFWF